MSCVFCWSWDFRGAKDWRICSVKIAERRQIGTVMPEGLATAMSAAERRDVVRFLLELGLPGSEGLENLLGQDRRASPDWHRHARGSGHCHERGRATRCRAFFAGAGTSGERRTGESARS